MFGLSIAIIELFVDGYLLTIGARLRLIDPDHLTTVTIVTLSDLRLASKPLLPTEPYSADSRLRP